MQDTQDLKDKAIKGFFWQFLQKISGSVISFVVTVVLTRILEPEEYGVVAIASMCVTFISLFGTVGLQIALVQKKEVDEIDLSTNFIGGLGISILLYAVLFVLAPCLADVFHEEEANWVIRTMGLSLLISSFSGVQNAVLTRRMDFRNFFWASISGTILSAILGISLAYSGFGVWALVVQNLSSSIFNTLILFVIVRWFPRLVFSWRCFKAMYSFAWKQMIANLIATASEQARGCVIGAKYSASDLAFYNRGDGLPGLIYSNINSTIQGVLFPALSKMQDDKAALKRGLSRSMKVSSYILMPALLGLGAVSDKLVLILYTEKWLPAVPFMQLVCIIYCFSLIGGANTQAITAMGRTDVVMKWEIMKRPMMLGILCITAFISPLAIATGQCIYAIGVCFFNAYPNKKLLGYPIREQIKDVGGNFLMSLVMVVAVYGIGLLPLHVYPSIVLQVFVGATIYLGLSIITENDSYLYIRDFALEKLYKK